MNSFLEVAKDIVRIVSMWPSVDSKISAVSSVLRFHAGSLEWFKETSLGEYAPCMPDPCSPGAIAKQIIEDTLEESDGAIQRTEALLYEWAVKLINSKTPNTDFNLTSKEDNHEYP